MRKLKKEFIESLDIKPQELVVEIAYKAGWKLEANDDLYDAEPMLIGNLEAMKDWEVKESVVLMMDELGDKDFKEVIESMSYEDEYVSWLEAKVMAK